MAANDNAPADAEKVKPIVRTSRRRPDVSYAVAGNVILPLCFAQRMPGWAPLGGASSAPPSGRAL
jgi:hypothetical protein